MDPVQIESSSPRSLPVRLAGEDLARSVTGLRAWTLEGDCLVRSIRFESYMAVLAFLGRLAPLAEQLQHHPDVDWRYDRLQISLTTPDCRGVSKLDVELARSIDDLTVP